MTAVKIDVYQRKSNTPFGVYPLASPDDIPLKGVDIKAMKKIRRY